MADEFGFTFCAILRRDKLYIAGVALELEEQDVPHAILFASPEGKLDNGGNWERWSLEHRLAGITAYCDAGVDKLIAVGVDGHIEIADLDGADEEDVGAHIADGPGPLRQLRCVRVIDGALYTAGNGRQVYRRPLAGASWERHDEGMLIVRGSGKNGSIHALDGAGALDGGGAPWLVAVGQGGEVWLRSEGPWRQLASPVSARLEAVRHLGGARFIAAGAQGAIVLGDGDALHMLDHGLTSETFTDIASAFGSVFLCTDQGALFRLDGAALSRVETGVPPNAGGGSLSSADGLLLWTTDFQTMLCDGAAWRELHPV